MGRVLPILFNTEMVRAILDGRKTVTRRVVKPQPICRGPNIAFTPHDNDFFLSAEKKWLRCRICGNDPEYSREGVDTSHHWKPPYLIGDILYVRETFCPNYFDESIAGYRNDGLRGNRNAYKADYNKDVVGDVVPEPKWKPSIHMPKEAARIWLKVTDVRVERLQEISGSDCIAEGVEREALTEVGEDFTKGMFHDMWDSTLKKSDLDRYGWDASPWVWVIEFERCEKPD